MGKHAIRGRDQLRRCRSWCVVCRHRGSDRFDRTAESASAYLPALVVALLEFHATPPTLNEGVLLTHTVSYSPTFVAARSIASFSGANGANKSRKAADIRAAAFRSQDRAYSLNRAARRWSARLGAAATLGGIGNREGAPRRTLIAAARTRALMPDERHLRRDANGKSVRTGN